MKVLLISCYELGHQPFSVVSAAAHLLSAGFDVTGLDLSVEAWSEDRVGRADVVAISIPMHTAIRLGVKAAERVRIENPSCHICFFGLYASLNVSYLLETVADSVIGGEFETPLVDHVAALADSKTGGTAGVSDRNRRSETHLGRIDFLAPARELLPPLEKYARLARGSELTLAGYVEASRGCAHQCLHCPITPVYEGRVRIVQEEVIRSDIAVLHAMGARHITFGDPDFLNAVSHSMTVARNLHADFPDMTFDVTAKVEHLLQHEEQVAELAKLGGLFVVSAVESLSDTVLRNLAKGHTRADVERALAVTRRVGMTLRPSLVTFTPWTSLDDVMDLLAWVDDENLHHQVDPVQFAIRLLVPPGSSLLAEPEMQRHVHSLNEDLFTWTWTHPDPRMDALHQEISHIVESAVAAREDSLSTFREIVAAAERAGGRSIGRIDPPPAVDPHPPRLTEAWFC